jgi:hypothetical protein
LDPDKAKELCGQHGESRRKFPYDGGTGMPDGILQKVPIWVYFGGPWSLKDRNVFTATWNSLHTAIWNILR